MYGAKKIIQTLIDNKTENIFGIPGGSTIPIYDELLNQESIRHVLVRHEQAAAHAADAYARIKQKPGVCMATSGPGSTNLITGIMTAYMDFVPLIALAGNVPTTLTGKRAFQETNIVDIAKPITKKSFRINSAKQIESIINNAFQTSMTGQKGPVLIDIPKDIQTQNTGKQKNSRTIFGKTIINFDNIKKAAKEILEAKRPVIIAGGGVISSMAISELNQLSSGLNIPVATTLMGKGCFDEENPLALGVLGMHGKKIANYAIANADVIISIGCRFSDRVTGNPNFFAQKAKIIQIEIEKKEVNKNVKSEIALLGDAKIILRELIKTIKFGSKKNSVWQEKIKKFVKECNCNIDINSNKIDPRKIIHELNTVLDKKDIVTTGTGQHQMFAMHFLKRSLPNTFITSGGSGTMGYGFPASIGAKIAAPQEKVINIDGDGSFAMVSQELATCKIENINTTQIIFNNSYLGMVRQWQELFLDKRYSHTHLKKSPDFAKLAEACGLTGTTIEKSSEIKQEIISAINNDETTILDCLIEEESNILPMFGAGANPIDMFGNCVQNKGVLF